MGFREKIQNRYTQSYLEKYGDRLISVQGNVVSIKMEEKKILWLFNKLTVILFIRPERSKSIVKCVYSKNKWFKKIPFIPINQGNLVIVQGMKGKKGKEDRETLSVLNILNQSNKKELFKTDTKPQKSVQKFRK
ncbi:MAG: hypothetical protein H7Y18_16535 [Clostridiaceae bacterium]|nr:hypothetical protein [Clostridiaceae bacterium]